MTELLDFTIEFNSGDVLSDRLEHDMFLEADQRLRELAGDHDDLRGAAVNVRTAAHGETTPLHEVTVVVYARPEHIAATEKHFEPVVALNGALSAVERQVREKRDRLGQSWEEPDKGRAATEIIETTAAEEQVAKEIEAAEEEQTD